MPPLSFGLISRSREPLPGRIDGFHDLDHFRIGLILLVDEADIEIFVVSPPGNGLIVIRKPTRANKLRVRHLVFDEVFECKPSLLNTGRVG